MEHGQPRSNQYKTWNEHLWLSWFLPHRCLQERIKRSRVKWHCLGCGACLFVLLPSNIRTCSCFYFEEKNQDGRYTSEGNEPSTLPWEFRKLQCQCTYHYYGLLRPKRNVSCATISARVLLRSSRVLPIPFGVDGSASERGRMAPTDSKTDWWLVTGKGQLVVWMPAEINIDPNNHTCWFCTIGTRQESVKYDTNYQT